MFIVFCYLSFRFDVSDTVWGQSHPHKFNKHRRSLVSTGWNLDHCVSLKEKYHLGRTLGQHFNKHADILIVFLPFCLLFYWTAQQVTCFSDMFHIVKENLWLYVGFLYQTASFKKSSEVIFQYFLSLALKNSITCQSYYFFICHCISAPLLPAIPTATILV